MPASSTMNAEALDRVRRVERQVRRAEVAAWRARRRPCRRRAARRCRPGRHGRRRRRRGGRPGRRRRRRSSAYVSVRLAERQRRSVRRAGDLGDGTARRWWRVRSWSSSVALIASSRASSAAPSSGRSAAGVAGSASPAASSVASCSAVRASAPGSSGVARERRPSAGARRSRTATVCRDRQLRRAARRCATRTGIADVVAARVRLPADASRSSGRRAGEDVELRCAPAPERRRTVDAASIWSAQLVQGARAARGGTIVARESASVTANVTVGDAVVRASHSATAASAAASSAPAGRSIVRRCPLAARCRGRTAAPSGRRIPGDRARTARRVPTLRLELAEGGDELG